MNTLRMLTVGMVFAAAATAGMAATDLNIHEVTVTAERPHAAALTVERVAPRTPVENTFVMPTAMPEADSSRWVTPRSLAAVIAFLLSDQAADISGATIPVYGRVGV